MAKKSILSKVQEMTGSSSGSEDKELEIQATNVFFRNQECQKPIVLNRGGGGSSKSYSLYQLFLYKFLNEEKKKFLICRKTLPACRASCYFEMNRLAVEYGVRDLIEEEKVFLNWYYGSNILSFKGLDDPEKTKSVNYNYILMEEATEFSYEDFLQYRLRLREPSIDGNKNQLFLAFNPIDEFHWIKTKVLDNPSYKDDVEEIFSTYKDNPFLSEDAVKVLEGLADQDPTFYNIYTLGQWGRLENLIYKNWETCDSIPNISEVDRICYGLDFGYNDPSVLIRVSVKGRDAWIEQLIYHTKLTTANLVDLMNDKIPSYDVRRRMPIYADPSRPEDIEEIRRAGFNVKVASRSILPGINTVKQHRLHVMSDALDVIRELKAYSWKKDRHGNVLDEPVGAFDHSPDAIRYALHSSSTGGTGLKIRWL
jgi:phage terminase large subunit